MLLQVELPGCKGIWTVYHKSSRSHTVDSSKTMTEDDEYHAYLIISLETRTMVITVPFHIHLYVKRAYSSYYIYMISILMEGKPGNSEPSSVLLFAKL